MLELKSVSKSFFTPGPLDILEGVDFKMSQGRTYSVVGKSGSGKSTLLSLIAGLDRPTSGQITFENQRYSDMNEAELTKFRGQNVGIVFQSFYLMPHLSAEENCTLALEIFGHRNPRPRAHELLEGVGLFHRRNHFPHQLSGGEQQRVAIARALMHHPKLLLADEPSGNLDEETGSKVMDLLFGVCQSSGSTLLLVTHNRELAKKCDHHMELARGALLENPHG